MPVLRRSPEPVEGKALQDKILHPFLFAVYPVLALLAYNVEEVRLGAAFRSLVVSLLGTTFLLLLFWLLLRNRRGGVENRPKNIHPYGQVSDLPVQAALLTTLTLGFFFSYGHIYNYLEGVTFSGAILGRHRFLFPAWLGLWAAGLWWAAHLNRQLRPATRALNAIAVIALVFPLARITLFGIRAAEASPGAQPGDHEFSQLHLPEGKPAPDIYYIILDGYARDDILGKFYRLDNQPFLERLDEMGFYVARCAQSNYAQTQLSLASSLNLNYLDALGERYTSGNASRVGLPELINHSAVRRALENLGYKTIAFETGYEATQLEDADLYLSPKIVQGVNDFEALLIRTTAGRLLAEGVVALNIKPDWEARDEAHRTRVLYALGELPKMPAVPGPKFVFAHIISPHWPHVFGPNGERVHEHPDSATGYRNQVIFINKMIEPVLAELIASSPTPPIIIIQGDHGSVIESPQRRMSILNAYHLPDGGNRRLYENISPVNTFRLIFDHYFGGNLDLLEDASKFSTYEQPYDYNILPDPRPGCP